MGTEDRGRPALYRRRLLALLGASSATALAGCSGDGGDGDGGTSPTAEPVPAVYETAAAQGGQQRDPGALSMKAAVNYQSSPKNGQQCTGCAFYIPDRNGDGMGACAVVEGAIDPEGWCASYAAHEGGSGTPTEEGIPATDGGTAEAVDVPADANCAVCDMTPADYPDWNAQAVHEDDTRAFFCSAGCATAYDAVPGEFASTDAAVAGLWVTEFETRELVDGTSAYYALETEAGRVEDPMGVNPAPFAARADAVAYVDAIDHLSEADIVELTAFDRGLAEQYRGRFLGTSTGS